MIAKLYKNLCSKIRELDVVINKTENSQRIEWLDGAKGLAMMTVVLYHVLLGFETAGMVESSMLLEYTNIYLRAAATPIFFIISGFFIERSMNKYGYKKFFKGALLFLVYPYFLWSIIQVVVKIIFASLVNKTETFDLISLLYEPVAQFWFLHALFLAQILFALMHKARNQNFLIAAVLFFAASFINGSFGFVADAFRSTGLLLVGVYLAKENRLVTIQPMKIALTGLIVLVLSAPLYAHLIMPMGIAGRSNFIGGIAMFIVVAAMLVKYGAPTILEIFGKYSMYIYVMHIMAIVPFRVVLMKLGVDIPLLSIAICTTAGLILPIIAAIIMEKMKISQFLGIKAVNHFQKDTK